MLTLNRQFPRMLVLVASICSAISVVAHAEGTENHIVNDAQEAKALLDAHHQAASVASHSGRINHNNNNLRGLQDEDDEDDDPDGIFGNRCNARNTCDEGFQCVGAAVGNRCQPVDCFTEVVKDFQENYFHEENYKAKLFAIAGVTEQQFAEGGSQINSLTAVRKNDPVKAVVDAMKVLPPPVQKLNEMASKCNSASEPGSTSTIGLWVEAGGLIDGGFSVMSGRGSTDDVTAVLTKFCLGGALGAGAEMSFLYGFHATGTVDDLTCASIAADADAGLGLALGVACIRTLTSPSTSGLEVTGGLGLGAELFGLSGCSTCQQ